MAIKLYNKTICPDDILRPLITAAAKRVPGVGTTVVVKILGPTRWGFRGMAHEGRPCLWHLTRKRQAGANRRRVIQSDGGWIELHIPRRHPADDHLALAERFFDLAVHEWSHIKDYQDEDRGIYRAKSQCERHDDRPQERRANAAVRRARDRAYSKTAEEAILELAIWLGSTTETPLKGRS